LADDNHPVVRAIAELEHGHESYAKRNWVDTFGRDDDYVSGLERAHHAHLESGEAPRAVRCAWWIGPQ
jgi:hypothetical protein